MAKKDHDLETLKGKVKDKKAELREAKLKLEYYQVLMKQFDVWQHHAYRAARSLDFDYILQSNEFNDEEKAIIQRIKDKHNGKGKLATTK